MLNTIHLCGAYYSAIKAVLFLVPDEKATGTEFLAAAAVAYCAGMGAMLLAPVSGPVGVVLAARDIYHNREKIKTGAVKLHREVKGLFTKTRKPVMIDGTATVIPIR